MPLHLLGKKSWNVYNADNVDRVRRDEADARAREEAAEQLMQEQDAERRIALMRGEQPPALPAVTDESHDNEHAHDPRQSDGRERKRRKLKGEDDTEREMRYAREDAEAGSRMRESFKQVKTKDAALDDAPLQDRRGQIQLVPAPEDGGGCERQPSKPDMLESMWLVMLWDHIVIFSNCVTLAMASLCELRTSPFQSSIM